MYYSGTVEEQRQFLLEPLQAAFGHGFPILVIPGNHDYYSGGSGFFQVTFLSLSVVLRVRLQNSGAE